MGTRPPEGPPPAATEGVGNRSPDTPTELLLRFARAGHDAGYPTADLEERLQALATSFGLADAEVSVTPTLVEISLGSLPRQRSYSLRVRPAAVDLDAIARLDDLVQDALDARLDANGALAALGDIEREPLHRPWPVLLAAYAVAGVALTPLLGGRWREAGAAALVGLVVGGIVLSTTRTARTEPMVAPIAAVAASFSAALLAWLGLDASADVVTLAALVTLLPGMTLTIGMRELSTEHLQSGVANTASALVQLFGLAFGVAIGHSIAVNWFGGTSASAPSPASLGIQLAAALLAALAFTVTLRARSRDALVMGAAACLAVGANEIGAKLFGDQAAVFVAAVVVGVAGGLVGMMLRRSALVFVVPGVLMLVPGSAGFDSVLQLLSDQTVSGITAGFDTFVTAMSIAYGLMVSTVLLPGRLRREP
ncbi:MAG: threonine/serine ThrE exporter family protein [Gaiellaceae bacterium]